jgi:peptidoglycan/xylan/chitin deacetylase (PgdA/CDA1 family)
MGLGALKSAVKALVPRAVVACRLGRTAAPAVLLTFDDGPHPAVTPAVLDRLDAHGAKAVFFVIGRRVKRAPHLLADIQARSHVLGNHTHLHRDCDVLANAPRPRLGFYYRDARRCQEVVARQTGRRPRLFRPPGGRLTPVTLLAPRLLGLRCVTWSAEVKDWAFRSAAEARAGAQQLLAAVAPGDIVLLHDNNPSVLDLLDVLLPGLTARGFDLAAGVRAV